MILYEIKRNFARLNFKPTKQTNYLKQNCTENRYFVTRIFTNDANQGLKKLKKRKSKVKKIHQKLLCEYVLVGTGYNTYKRGNPSMIYYGMQ